jgi:hypothetical protein
MNFGGHPFLGVLGNKPLRSGLFPKTLTRRRHQPIDLGSRLHPQGEICGGFVNHSRAAAHEVLGTRSTARDTANTNKAKLTITTQLFIVRCITTSSFPPLLRRGVLPSGSVFLPRNRASRFFG